MPIVETLTVFVWLLAALATLLLLIAALGVLRLPDALARQHASTKAGTIAISLFASALAGYALLNDLSYEWWLRLLLLLVLLLITLPVASHALARSASSEQQQKAP